MLTDLGAPSPVGFGMGLSSEFLSCDDHFEHADILENLYD